MNHFDVVLIATREQLIMRNGCKTYENAIKSPKSVPSKSSSRLDWSLLWCRFWTSGLMFDTPVLFEPQQVKLPI